ncbi:hypothetical protein DAEQUDRAFT_813357 [Daedalea quercina L-15889]|uniref:REJ domain-containing protein n=1 Tax=Daedalea quercina L-15889 TaxID=1314783 RepID=A0A165N8Q0_9APHY|nr:hypothetical protein DAEQUDRAFT_813357 [Daedalea quercina L-15889]
MSDPLSSLFAPSSSSTSASTTTSDTSTSLSTSSSSSTTTTSSSTTSTSTSTSTTTTSSSVSSSSSSSSSSTSSSSLSSSSSSQTSSSSSSSQTSDSSTTSADGGSTSTGTTTTPATTSFITSLSTETSGGSVQVVTRTVPGTSSSQHTGSANNDSTSGGSTSFFQNKGEVAGVFAAVGIVAAIIIVALITHAIRRRRAKKFDDEVANAAAEAAAQAHHAPNFTDDDYGYPEDRTKEYGPYSDTASHGTFNQPPMQPGESYNMAELAHFDPYAAAGGAPGEPYAAAGAAGDPYSAAGAAGVGAAGLNRARSMGQSNTHAATPYNAFAVPQLSTPQNQAYYDNPYGAAAAAQVQQSAPNRHVPTKSVTGTEASLDLLDAAGLGVAAGVGTAAAGANLNRNKSLGANTLATSASEYSSSHAGNNAAYGGYYGSQPPPGARPPSIGDPFAAYHTPSQTAHTQPQQPSPSQSDRVSAVDLPNPFTQASPEPPLLGTKFNSPESTAENGEDDDDEPGPAGGLQNQESRYSLRDEEDYGYGGGRRVLKVANE